MKVIYGTKNKNKILEMQKYLKKKNIEVISLEDIGFKEDIIEDGDTFLANSLIKAKAIKKYCQDNNINYPILTDDAGLCVKALDNRPGVYTARYVGDHAPQIECINKLLGELQQVSNREAAFYCALTFVLANEFIQVEGCKEGTISNKIGKLGGFTFGPIFIPKGYDKPYNELEEFETHRALAIKKLINVLEEKNII